MARLNLNELDDPLLSDACAGFSGGQNSFIPPDQLQPNQAAALVNIDINDGTATTRRGAETLGDPSADAALIQGLFWFDTPTRERLVAIENTEAQEYDGSSWVQIATYAAGSATAQVCMAQLIEKLYIADGTSNLQEWDGTTLTDLGSTTASGNPPDNISIIISAYGAIWAAGISTAPDTLWRSKTLDADANGWDATFGNLRVGQGEGDPITGLCEMDDYQIAVFKRNSIYLLRANPGDLTYADAAHSLAVATITKISDTVGCVSHRSIVRIGPDAWFLSDTGVHSLRRVIAQEVREVDYKPLSEPVQDVIDRINWTHASKAAATFWKNRYLLSLPLDDDTAPSTVLAFNTLRQSWSGTWTGWDASCWALSKPNGSERLCFGRSDGAVWRWLDYTPADSVTEVSYQDAGEDYASSVTTRAMLFGDALNSKNAFNVQAEFFNSEATVNLGVRLDEQEPQTLNPAFPTTVGVLLLPFNLPATLPARGLKKKAFGAQHLPQFDRMQAVAATDAGKMSLRAVIATGFLNSIDGEK